MTADLIVCGLGPAGRALTHRCLAHGMSVTAIDPAPSRRWSATYAGWYDELPRWLDPSVIATTVTHPTAWGTRPHRLDRTYVVFDSTALRDSLNLDGAQIVADRVVEIRHNTVTLASETKFSAERVIDARGIPRAPGRAEQTAYGVVVPSDTDIAPLFMDWRADNGTEPDAPRSFLYAVPLSAETMLLEETCLAGRPALDTTVLRERLHYRLRSRGIELTGSEQVERVRFPVQGGRPGPRRFGAAGAFTHPATGYSVTAALAAADTVALDASAWPAQARVVHTLRSAGLRALLALPPADLPVFFDTFFTLPPHLQRAYLSGRTDLGGTVAAMRTLFATLPAPLRRRVATATLGIPIRSPIRIGSSMME
ncbi:lycopene cyclase family protein [Nocardia sp. NPDC052112]|uniref:lycopene cyclase family protein n=1 Tax=Nocardia sp. NPDC052112 TaxID=3155646 RepID=UPI00341F7801